MSTKWNRVESMINDHQFERNIMDSCDIAALIILLIKKKKKNVFFCLLQHCVQIHAPHQSIPTYWKNCWESVVCTVTPYKRASNKKSSVEHTLSRRKTVKREKGNKKTGEKVKFNENERQTLTYENTKNIPIWVIQINYLDIWIRLASFTGTFILHKHTHTKTQRKPSNWAQDMAQKI